MTENVRISADDPIPVQAYVLADQQNAALGLSRREWFAGQALVGLLALNLTVGRMPLEEANFRELGRKAYQLADAMLAEGSK